MTDLFERVLLPVADPEDATATARALRSHDVGSVLALHVVEKAGGAIDKASVEQREEWASEMFDAVEAELSGTGMAVETDVAFGTDVAEAIFDAASDYGATSIVITPRGGSRWIRLLTGDVALDLVTETDRPVVVLPDGAATGDGDAAGNSPDDGATSGDAEVTGDE